MKAKRTRKVANKSQVTLPTIGPWRLGALVVLLGLLPLSLIWHMANLQVVPGAEKGYAFLQRQGDARTLREEKISAYRGVITDRNGEILAVSTPVTSIYANPQRLDMPRLPELAAALGLSPDRLASKLTRYAEKQFVYLKRQMPPHEANRVLALGIAGVHGEEEFQRYYPAGEVAAHVVGFTNIDERGQEGMELALDDFLAGAAGVRQVIKDLKGNVVKDLGIQRAASSGNDVHLSIDLRLQYLAYRELKAAVADQGAASGSVVIMDVHSGEILAMANQPSYNPNNRSKLQAKQLRNRAITDLFEPGSTIKPFTVLSAFETGQYQPSTQIDTNPGYFRVAGKTYSDFKNYGLIDLTTVIKKSSQVGISKLAMQLDPGEVRNMLYRVGFGQSTGVGFPGEAVGLLPDRQKWHPTERAAMAFGHGLSVTSLQLAQAYAAIASGGLMRPSSLLRQQTVPEAQRVLPRRHALQMIDMLRTVTESGGTATRAKMSAYEAAGKTGTAHKVGTGGYADDKYIALFAGMAPADDPQIVIVVVINEPPVQHYYGGEAAAPIFAKVAEGSLRMLHVPPHREVAVQP